MRCGVLLAALAATVAAQAMPLGLRTAMWGVAAANRRAVAGDVFPELGETATAAEITAALDGAADGALAANIADAADYGDFRNWARGVGAAAVKASGTAWLSFALGTDRLIGRDITSNDVHIVSFKVADAAVTGGSLGTVRPASFAFEVAIDGVDVGSALVAKETLKANLKKVLGLEGAATLTPGAFSADNIEITFDMPVDGKARFTATPPPDAGNAFFMRVKIK